MLLPLQQQSNLASLNCERLSFLGFCNPAVNLFDITGAVNADKRATLVDLYCGISLEESTTPLLLLQGNLRGNKQAMSGGLI